MIQKLAPFLKMYSEYVKNFERAAELLATWTDKSPQFQDVLNRIQVSLGWSGESLYHHPHVQQLGFPSDFGYLSGLVLPQVLVPPALPTPLTLRASLTHLSPLSTHCSSPHPSPRAARPQAI